MFEKKFMLYKKGHAYTLPMDLSKAFDTTNRELLAFSRKT